MKRFCSLLFCLSLLNFLPNGADAIMVGLSTKQLTVDASTIVLGKIIGLESKWTEDRSTIITVAKVQVAEVYKGEPTSDIIFVEYEGGKVGNVGLMVSDTKIPSVADRVMLFLRHKEVADPDSNYIIVAKGQGQYTADEDNILHKEGFSVAEGADKIDTEIPLESLVNKIRNSVK